MSDILGMTLASWKDGKTAATSIVQFFTFPKCPNRNLHLVLNFEQVEYLLLHIRLLLTQPIPTFMDEYMEYSNYGDVYKEDGIVMLHVLENISKTFEEFLKKIAKNALL